MERYTKEQLKRHIKTHSERSDDDRNAIAVLNSFLRSDGRINTDIAVNDTWPNHDGTLEIVSDPSISRQPKCNFFVQVKGTSMYTNTDDGGIKYQLQSLAFPAYIANEVTLDPGILFVVLDAGKRGKERVFWKYMSHSFLANIDFNKNSKSITFSKEDELENTDLSVEELTKKLVAISATHSFSKLLSSLEYTEKDVISVVLKSCSNISQSIENGFVLNQTRDNIAQNIYTHLRSLCESMLILNGLRFHSYVTLRESWEIALTDINTKFLASFLQGLRYIDIRLPDDGQYERLLLKYYNFLWNIRELLRCNHNISVLENLEKFPRVLNYEDEEYNQKVVHAIESKTYSGAKFNATRFYIQKKTPIYVGTQRYFEYTLQLADLYASKYNRFTAYSKHNISTRFSIQIATEELDVYLWENTTNKVKYITSWKVSIAPQLMNKLSKIVGNHNTFSSKYTEYHVLMDFFTVTGISLIDFVDFEHNRFESLIDKIYANSHTENFKDTLQILHKKFNNLSKIMGHNTIRYLLLNFREDTIVDVMPSSLSDKLSNTTLLLSKKCYPFEKNPVFYNFPGHKTSALTHITDVVRAVGSSKITEYIPYMRIMNLIYDTGELYFTAEEAGLTLEDIEKYNKSLALWDRQSGFKICEDRGYLYIDSYVQDTMSILQSLYSLSRDGNDGQASLNNNFIKKIDIDSIDDSKEAALKKVFVNSKVIVIYGAAGTGKTMLMNMLSNLMGDSNKLFLAKTHTALDNLKRRIENPGVDGTFKSVDSIIRGSSSINKDVIFIDECTTIDNRSMAELLKKINDDALLVLAGDTYQIESIDFGNWFFYAKDILPDKSIVELTNNWRAKGDNIKSLWDAVRFKEPIITEMLVIDGPYSENISKNIFINTDPDEVVLCLNYDGKFGLNNINNYFQDANSNSKAFIWKEWKYKIGDKILFNENSRFPILHNNLKGIIVDISEEINGLTFTIDVEKILTAQNIRGTELEIIHTNEKITRIKLPVYLNDQFDEETEDSDISSIVPFQLAYAVSIHKAQGLEYNSVKVVIPNNNSEKITHGIFYTAITRAKEKLKIYWSPETMEQIISDFNKNTSYSRSLEIFKEKFLEMDV